MCKTLNKNILTHVEQSHIFDQIIQLFYVPCAGDGEKSTGRRYPKLMWVVQLNMYVLNSEVRTCWGALKRIHINFHVCRLRSTFYSFSNVGTEVASRILTFIRHFFL